MAEIEGEQRTLPLNDTVLSPRAYAIVRNIPKAYHAKHLRYFFSYDVENRRFHCFHYRHRPEVHVHNDVDEASTSKVCERFCCVVSFKNEEERAVFIKRYHQKFWTDEEGCQMSLKCFIFPLRSYEVSAASGQISPTLDFRSLIELKPPSLMPHGNVGTPTEFFLEQIRLCKLPPSVFSKLGIKIRKRISKYGAVSFIYDQGKETIEVDSKKVTPFSFLDRNLCLPKEIIDTKFALRNNEVDDIGDQYEEWERHEALHDDVTEQERTKPRKYEMEQEVTWEKGGPGLVWYTDAFFWKQLEEGTDSDWKWVDDWDVDYSIYYDRKDGDLDAKHSVEMIEDQKLRSGEISHSVFKKRRMKGRQRRNSERPLSAIGFGQFEECTRGIGSKIMKRYGWFPGIGLGAHNSGRLEAVSAEIEEIGGAQNNKERKGFGYRGEKLQRTGFFKGKKRGIATKYDQWNLMDSDSQISKVLRRDEPTFMKYR